MPEHNIVLLTGERQVGKSTLCRKLANLLRENSFQITGLLTDHSGDHDLVVTEIHTGQIYPLTLPFNPLEDRPLGRFIFAPAALQRSNHALEASFPTQVFMLDELGPLEFVHHEGWVEAFHLLTEQDYDTAFVVVRPELLYRAIGTFPASVYTVVCIREDNRDVLLSTLYHMAVQPR
jgi:nucleoside-triphosphatase THEP1